jgi:hypothetical protein
MSLKDFKIINKLGKRKLMQVRAPIRLSIGCSGWLTTGNTL